MNALNLHLDRLVNTDSDEHVYYENFLKAISIATEQEIVDFLKYSINTYLLETPFGVKLISFRLLCLLNPDNAEYKEWAESIVGHVGGPEWDLKVKW